MKRVVITINRQYGSGGKTIGYMLAENSEFHATAEKSCSVPPRKVVLMRVCSMHEMNA